MAASASIEHACQYDRQSCCRICCMTFVYFFFFFRQLDLKKALLKESKNRYSVVQLAPPMQQKGVSR